MTDRDPEAKSFDSLKSELFSKHPEIEKQYDARQKAKAFVTSVRNDLSSLRKQKNMKQTEMARNLGVSQPVISRIESDRSADLGLETLYRYADACGMKPVVTFVPNSEAAFDNAITRAMAMAWNESLHDRKEEHLALRKAQQIMLMSLTRALHVTVDKTMRTMVEDLPASDVYQGKMTSRTSGEPAEEQAV